MPLILEMGKRDRSVKVGRVSLILGILGDYREASKLFFSLPVWIGCRDGVVLAVKRAFELALNTYVSR